MSKNPFTQTNKVDSVAPIEKTSPSSTRSKVPPSHQRHASRPSQDLAEHERAVRKDSRARKTIPRDQIDDLDNILGSYHHEGPFDATLASRQIPGRAPIEATKVGNSLALAATPAENLRHSLDTHEPLDGTSRHASGTVVSGKRYNYAEEDVERKERPGTDYGSDDGGIFDGDIARDDPHSSRGKRSENVEMQSSRGIVEYSADLDDDDQEESIGSIGNAAGPSSKHSVLSGLKKRLSIKK